MIPVTVDAPSAPRSPLQRSVVTGEDHRTFRDILEREEVPKAPEDEEQQPSITESQAGSGQALTQTSSLETLLAQIAPGHQTSVRRAPDADATQDLANPRSTAIASGLRPEFLNLPVQHDEPVTGSSNPFEHGMDETGEGMPEPKLRMPFGSATEQRRERDAAAGENGAQDSRAVVVRHVTSAVYYPVIGDPVRQIVSEVARAMAEPVGASSQPDQAQPVKTVQVQLEPESLGTVTLRLRLSGNHLSVRLDVAEPATLKLIQREQDRLHQNITSDGVVLERLEIRASVDPSPVQASASSPAAGGDLNAAGQQSRMQGDASGGQSRSRENRRHSEPGHMKSDRHEAVPHRSSAPRGLYL